MSNQVGWQLTFTDSKGTFQYKLTVSVGDSDDNQTQKLHENSQLLAGANSKGTTALLLNCSGLAEICAKMGLTYDESFMEESALHSVKKSIHMKD